MPGEAGTTFGAWIAAAETLCDQGLVLLVTSRWCLPDWPEADHWQLEHASYGDFLQQARALRRLLKNLLAVSLVEQREAPDLLTRE